MIRVLFTVFLIVTLSVAGLVPDVPAESELPEKLSVQILTPEQLEDYRAANPGVVLTALERVASKAAIRYTLGSRVSGDVLAAYASENLSWPSPTNAQFSLSYPSSGAGRKITFVEINVEQSSNEGVFLIKGGVNQQYITIFIEACQTTSLIYKAAIYGL